MEKKAVIRNFGVSTETYFMIDAHRIPRKGLHVVFGSGLWYYQFFIRSARKITEKAKDIFYKTIFCNGFY